MPGPFNPVAGQDATLSLPPGVIVGKVRSGGITAFDGTDAGEGDFSIQLIRPGDTEVLDTTEKRHAYNMFDAYSEDTYLLFDRDSLGRFWVLGSAGIPKKPKCIFTLDADLAQDEEYEDATISVQYGYGTDHTSTSIVVYNIPKSSGDYIYYGSAGAYGVASYSNESNAWYIDMMECP